MTGPLSQTAGSGVGPQHPCTAPPLLRPSLEYQHAFDLCATEAYRGAGAVTVYASGPFYARELLLRLNDIPTRLIAVGNWSSPPGDGGASPVGQDASAVAAAPSSAEGERSLGPAQVVIWAEAHPQDLAQSCGMGPWSAPEATVYAISSGWLARFLPEWQAATRRPPGLRWTLSWLRGEGLRVRAVYGFHGPASIAWGLAIRLAAVVGRPDWADRCLAAMRASYVVSGWQAVLAPVATVVAGRG